MKFVPGTFDVGGAARCAPTGTIKCTQRESLMPSSGCRDRAFAIEVHEVREDGLSAELTQHRR